MATYSTTNAPLPWMEPYLQDYMSRSQEMANQPYQQSPGTYTGPNQYLQAGWDATANRAMQGDGTMDVAKSQLQSNIVGDYLNPNSNPYLQQYVQQGQQDTVNAYNQVQRPAWDKAMQGSGSFGNTGVSEYAAMDANNLQKNLGQQANNAYMGAYNTDRGYQQQSIGMAPTFANQSYLDASQLLNVGNQAQTFNQGQQNQNNQWFQDAQNYPKQQMQAYGQSLGIGGQGGTSTQNQPDPAMLSQLFGGMLAGSSLYSLIGG